MESEVEEQERTSKKRIRKRGGERGEEGRGGERRGKGRRNSIVAN